MSEEKEPITWAPKLIKVEDLVSNPQNPKIVNEVGKERMQKSLSKFGLAGSIVANLDLTIIDGHSRVEDAIKNGVEEVWVSLPSRLLTEEEYNEMNAIFDLAQAGDMDMFMVKNTLGDEVITEWDINETKGKKSSLGNTVEAKLPLVPQYDEKHEAIVILCNRSLDTTFIKNLLGIGPEMSYKNSMVKETSIITAKKFIEVWKKNSKS